MVSTLVLLLAVVLGVALPAILSRGSKPERVGVVGGNTTTLTSVVTEAGRLAGVKVTVVPEPDVATAKAGLRSGHLSAVLVSGQEVLVKQVPIGGASSAGGTLPGALAQLAGLSKLSSRSLARPPRRRTASRCRRTASRCRCAASSRRPARSPAG